MSSKDRGAGEQTRVSSARQRRVGRVAVPAIAAGAALLALPVAQAVSDSDLPEVPHLVGKVRGHFSRPVLVAGPRGESWLLWERDLSIEVAQISPAGVLAGEPARLTDSNTKATYPHADSGPPGRTTLVWQEWRNRGTSYTVPVMEKMEGTTLPERTARLGPFAASGPEGGAPPLALDVTERGSALVVVGQWDRRQGSYDLLVARRSGQGSVVEPQPIGGDVSGMDDDQVAAVADGSGLVAWVADGATPAEIRVARPGASGSWRTLARGEDADQASGVVTAVGGGLAYVAWSSSDGVHAVALSTRGSLRPLAKWRFPTSGTPREPALTVDRAGVAALTWAEDRAASDPAALRLALLAPGARPAAETVAQLPPGTSERAYSITALGRGRFAAAWVDGGVRGTTFTVERDGSSLRARRGAVRPLARVAHRQGVYALLADAVGGRGLVAWLAMVPESGSFELAAAPLPRASRSLRVGREAASARRREQRGSRQRRPRIRGERYPAGSAGPVEGPGAAATPAPRPVSETPAPRSGPSAQRHPWGGFGSHTTQSRPGQSRQPSVPPGSAPHSYRPPLEARVVTPPELPLGRVVDGGWPVKLSCSRSCDALLSLTLIDLPSERHPQTAPFAVRNLRLAGGKPLKLVFRPPARLERYVREQEQARMRIKARFTDGRQRLERIRVVTVVSERRRLPSAAQTPDVQVRANTPAGSAERPTPELAASASAATAAPTPLSKPEPAPVSTPPQAQVPPAPQPAQVPATDAVKDVAGNAAGVTAL